MQDGIARQPRRIGLATGHVGIDPVAGLFIARKLVCDRNGDVVVPGGQLDIAHFRRSVRAITVLFGARQRPRHHIKANQESGEFIDAVGNQSQPADHVPLIRQHERRAARADGAGIRDRDAHDGTFFARQRIDDRRARLGTMRDGIPDCDFVRHLSGKLAQHLHGLHAALAMTDHHRTHAVVLVLPGNHAGELAAVLVGAVRPITGLGVADLRFRVAHSSQKAAE